MTKSMIASSAVRPTAACVSDARLDTLLILTPPVLSAEATAVPVLVPPSVPLAVMDLLWPQGRIRVSALPVSVPVLLARARPTTVSPVWTDIPNLRGNAREIDTFSSHSPSTSLLKLSSFRE